MLLVTGATGNVGGALGQALARAGERVSRGRSVPASPGDQG